MKTKLYSVITLFACFALVALPNSFAQEALLQPSVRLIYFLPNDRPVRPDRVKALQQLIIDVQQFYAEQMEYHGYDGKTFAVETDKNAEPLVHHIDGKFAEEYYYKEGTGYKVWEEILEHFDNFQHIYFTVIDLSSETLHGGKTCGESSLYFSSMGEERILWRIRNTTQEEEVLGGFVIIPASGVCFEENRGYRHRLGTPSHELGHAFGLDHDFREGPNSDYVMAYGHQSRLSKCAAEWLSVSRFFNSRQILRNDPTKIQLLSSQTHGQDTIRLRFEVTDPDGLHQAQLLVGDFFEGDGWGAHRLFDCKRLKGEKSVVESDIRIEELVDSVALQITDVSGHITWATFPIDVSSLLPPPKVVSIPDPNLERAIRAELGLATLDAITDRAMRKLRSLNVDGRGITNIAGLEYATQLEMLSIGKNQIDNYRRLSQLPKLTKLYLWDNNIKNLNVLPPLPRLELLDLNWNQISDVSPLTEFTNLKELWLQGNRLADTSTLFQLHSGAFPPDEEVEVVKERDDADRAYTLLMFQSLDLKVYINPDVIVFQSLNSLRNAEQRVPTAKVLKGIIPDPNLAAALRSALVLGPNALITKQKMRKLTELRAKNSQIADLTGLEHATGLRVLSLSDNQISDLTPLAKLTQLKGISLFRNQINNLTPLAKLIQLTRLDLGGNQIRNITPLAGLTQLDWLSLWENQINNLRPLVSLTQLNRLDLRNNQISNVTPLTKLIQLRELQLHENQIRDVSPLARLVNLETLYLKGNPIQDASPLAALTKLRDMDIEIPRSPSTVHVESADHPQMYWVNTDNRTLHRLVGAEVENLVPRIQNATHLAIDVANEKLYWTEQTGNTTGRIRRANLDGTNVQLVKDLTSVPHGIVLDTANGKIYLTNSWGKVQRLNLDGSNFQPNLITGLDMPKNLDLDVSGGKVYWTEMSGRIRRANLDGSNVQDIATGLGTLMGLVVFDGTVYWTEMTGENQGKIQRVNLDGTNTEMLLTLTSIPRGITLDPMENKLYWTNSRGKIQRANLDGSNIENLITGLVAPGDFILQISPPLPPTVPVNEIVSTDVNGDGVVNIQDLVLVASGFGQTGQNAADVNGDGIVNIQDLVLVAGAFGSGAAAAPTLHLQVLEGFTALDVQHLLTQAREMSHTDPAYLRGIAVLEQLFASLLPRETALLPNYPNPFNPETWIPYQLARSGDVNITIYDARGAVVRRLALGHQPAGDYTNRSRAVYWDGCNALGERVASGVYFYQLETDTMSALRKMVILK